MQKVIILTIELILISSICYFSIGVYQNIKTELSLLENKAIELNAILDR